jgi:hypothetical protein
LKGVPSWTPQGSTIIAPSKIPHGSFRYPIFLPFFRQILLPPSGDPLSTQIH